MVGDGRVYVGLSGGAVAALDPASGETDWTAETPRPDASADGLPPTLYSVSVTDCSVFVVADGDIDAFDLAGEHRWHVDGYYYNLATDGTTLYGRDRTGDPLRTVLRARDAGTGELVWERRADVRSLAHGVLSTDALYLPLHDALAAFDRTDGGQRWHTTPAVDRLAVADGTIYGRDEAGSLVALE